MEQDPLQKVHKQLLAVQNALEVGGVGYWRVHDDGRSRVSAAVH
mgnify:CR=1 FL=1